MPIVFNPIACRLPLSNGELEVAGVPMGRILADLIRCRVCGARYSVIIPHLRVSPALADSIDQLERLVSASCSEHPPIIQIQADPIMLRPTHTLS
jgi:hypothetical protein